MAADAMDRCIAACVKDGMKLQFALKKFNVQLGSSGKNEYRRLYRTINKLKKQEVAETSALFCFVVVVVYILFVSVWLFIFCLFQFVLI